MFIFILQQYIIMSKESAIMNVNYFYTYTVLDEYKSFLLFW